MVVNSGQRRDTSRPVSSRVVDSGPYEMVKILTCYTNGKITLSGFICPGLAVLQPSVFKRHLQSLHDEPGCLHRYLPTRGPERIHTSKGPVQYILSSSVLSSARVSLYTKKYP